MDSQKYSSTNNQGQDNSGWGQVTSDLPAQQNYAQNWTNNGEQSGYNQGLYQPSSTAPTSQPTNGGGANPYSDLMSKLQQLQKVVTEQAVQSQQAPPKGQPNGEDVNEQQQQQQNQQSLTQQLDQNVSNSSTNIQGWSQQQQASYPTQATTTATPNNVNPMQFNATAMPPLYQSQYPGFDMTSQQQPAFNPYMFGMPQPGMGWLPQPSSAASFHQQGPKNEIKLFIGGLQFQTTENDLFQYFSQFGHVVDAIIMRDKATGRGRGFSFVKMAFKDEEEAQRMKEDILAQNRDPSRGHYILDKKVDVKSADDYSGKGQQQQTPQGPPIQKPNPYVIAETKNDGDGEVTYKYPKSKIFVGGLDFKLTVEELKEHFSQYGEVLDAIILKDIYTGQSRGFGFVTFKDEDVAQNLISNIQVTTINGRKADIKSSQPKAGGKSFLAQRGGGYMQGGQNAPAMIPPYGSYPAPQYGISPARGASYEPDELESSKGYRESRRYKRRGSSASSERSDSHHRRRRSGRDYRDKKERSYRHKDDSRGRRRRSRSRSPFK